MSVPAACSTSLVGSWYLWAEYLDDLLSVNVDISLHHVHARTKQSLERRHVQHWMHFHPHSQASCMYNIEARVVNEQGLIVTFVKKNKLISVKTKHYNSVRKNFLLS